MITYNTPLYQSLAIVSYNAPASTAAGTVSTTAVDAGLYGRLLFVVLGGLVDASTTLDFKLQASATSGGSYTDVSGFAITQYVAADDNKIALVEISSEQLVAAETTAGTSVLNKYRWVKGVATVGGSGNAVVGLLVIAAHGRFKRPENVANIAAVKETVSPIASSQP